MKKITVTLLLALTALAMAGCSQPKGNNSNPPVVGAPAEGN